MGHHVAQGRPEGGSPVLGGWGGRLGEAGEEASPVPGVPSKEGGGKQSSARTLRLE